MADLAATQTSNKDEWMTPWWFVKLLESEFGEIDLDPCASLGFGKAKKYFTEAENGLLKPWFGTVFCNPPYSQISKWATKAFMEADMGNATVLFLCAARTDTRWWWNSVRHAEVRFIKGRIKFEEWGKEKAVGAPFPSALVVFRKHFHQAFTPTTVYWEIPKEMRNGIEEE